MSHMPEFKTLNEFNEWNKKQREGIPYDECGMPSFESSEHFCKVLEHKGFENVREVHDGVFEATIKIIKGE